MNNNVLSERVQSFIDVFAKVLAGKGEKPEKVLDHKLDVIVSGNSKVSKYCGVVNMPPCLTCSGDAPCKNDCYCMKNHYCKNRENAYTRTLRNYKWVCDDINGFFDKIFGELLECDYARPYKFFRWHETGDIVNYQYFCKMVDIARSFKHTKFMCYTKKYAIVNRWIDENGELPKNLIVIFSMWGDYGKNENKHNLPISFLNSLNPELTEKPTIKCSGKCLDCKFKCWRLKENQSVMFNKH